MAFVNRNCFISAIHSVKLNDFWRPGYRCILLRIYFGSVYPAKRIPVLKGSSCQQINSLKSQLYETVSFSMGSIVVAFIL